MRSGLIKKKMRFHNEMNNSIETRKKSNSFERKRKKKNQRFNWLSISFSITFIAFFENILHLWENK